MGQDGNKLQTDRRIADQESRDAPSAAVRVLLADRRLRLARLVLAVAAAFVLVADPAAASSR